MWQTQAGVTVTAYDDLAAGTAGDLSSKTAADAIGEARGVGVAGGAAGEELDQGQALRVSFDQAQTHFSVGFRDL